MSAAKASVQSGPIELVRLRQRTVLVPIVGISPYIPHKWAEKAIQKMRDKQFSENPVKAKLTAKNPEEEAFEATYWIEPARIPGAPATGFKIAMVDAVRSFSGLTMVQAKTMFFVRGEGRRQLVRLHDTEWEMQEDLPRLANGNPDLRYRNYIFPWRAELEISFKQELINAESIIALVAEGGSMGIGDWRPSAAAGGIYGQWEIDVTREVQLR